MSAQETLNNRGTLVFVKKRKKECVLAQLCPTHCDPMDCTRLLCPWNSLGKNTEVNCQFHLQGIFPTQGSNLGLQHCGQIPYHLSHSEADNVFVMTDSNMTFFDFGFKQYLEEIVNCTYEHVKYP